MKKLCVLCAGVLLSSLVYADDVYINVNRNNNRYNRADSRYEHIYMNPPKPSLYSNGRYVMISSGVRYVHSKSKLKRAAHAARINAYNYQLGNY